MKKYNFICIILVCIIVASIILFCKAVYEDEDFIFDILCNTDILPLYAEFFISILLCMGILYEYGNSSFSSQSVIAYLERYEKSPPTNSVIFVTA
jgi:hypothetical protein